MFPNGKYTLYFGARPAEVEGEAIEAPSALAVDSARVEVRDKGAARWRDYFVNNWFHRWGADTDRKILAHYANTDPHYSVYGYLGGIAAPFDAAGQELIKRYEPVYTGIIYHGRVVAAKNEAGFEIRVLHLMGRHKKTLRYEVFHGNGAELVKLDQKPPK